MSSWFSFLASRGARLDASGVADFGDPAAELAAARDHAVLVDLSHNALLAVTGDDATAFLHAQLTNDVQSLPEGAAQWNGWCSPKGRLLATFLVLRRADGFRLMLPADIAPAIAKRLAMFVLRSKVKVADASESTARLAFAGKTAGVIVARHFGFTPDPMRSVEKDGATCIALDAERFVILVPTERAPGLWEKLAENATPAGPDAWAWSLIQAGIPVVTAATQEAFVPQMANFELVGGVSFHKGCYPGQEIVARTQYRGILKRRMALAHLAGERRPAAGESVYGAAFGDQAAGTIVNAAPAPGGGYDALVVAQLESLSEGDLRWSAPDGPRLEIRARPYEREVPEPASRG
ncbi:MAG TPA: folate-binding protein YgfZ [Usitatibacter sp.]|nr:folate-binding protein YgfZ [Usitatibacter sp.]